MIGCYENLPLKVITTVSGFRLPLWCGVDIYGQQEGKGKKVLQFFATVNESLFTDKSRCLSLMPTSTFVLF